MFRKSCLLQEVTRSQCREFIQQQLPDASITIAPHPYYVTLLQCTDHVNPTAFRQARAQIFFLGMHSQSCCWKQDQAHHSSASASVPLLLSSTRQDAEHCVAGGGGGQGGGGPGGGGPGGGGGSGRWFGPGCPPWGCTYGGK